MLNKHSYLYVVAMLIVGPPVQAQQEWERSIDVAPVHNQIGTINYSLGRAIDDGKRLFSARFTIADGFGRPKATGDSKPSPRLVSGPLLNRIVGPDSNSCSGCHNQPVVGGSGDFVSNVFVGAHFTDPPIDSIAPSRTNERNTTDLFGTGAIEILAGEMTRELQAQRDLAVQQSARTGTSIAVDLLAKGLVRFGSLVAHPDGTISLQGVEGVDSDLVVRPFGVKGIAASLREFTIAALNQHHGIQANERFGWERTGVRDFDGDGVEEEFTTGQMTAIVLFQAALKVPPTSPAISKHGGGLEIFREVGCAECHVEKIRLDSHIFKEPNALNRPGDLNRKVASVVKMELDLGRDEVGWFLRPFSDIRRHEMCDAEINFLCNEELKQDNVSQSQFLTSRLWNLANNAPYCHRGDCLSINQAILVHGGEAHAARQAYWALPQEKKEYLWNS